MDNDKVHYLNQNHMVLDDSGILNEGIMPGLLHPNKHGYRLWVEAMEAAIKRLLND